MKDWFVVLLYILYHIGAVATFGFLTFFDGTVYNWWNWLIIVPVNLFLGEIWPIYWAILRPFVGS